MLLVPKMTENMPNHANTGTANNLISFLALLGCEHNFYLCGSAVNPPHTYTSAAVIGHAALDWWSEFLTTLHVVITPD